MTLNFYYKIKNNTKETKILKTREVLIDTLNDYKIKGYIFSFEKDHDTKTNEEIENTIKAGESKMYKKEIETTIGAPDVTLGEINTKNQYTDIPTKFTMVNFNDKDTPSYYYFTITNTINKKINDFHITFAILDKNREFIYMEKNKYHINIDSIGPQEILLGIKMVNSEWGNKNTIAEIKNRMKSIEMESIIYTE